MRGGRGGSPQLINSPERSASLLAAAWRLSDGGRGVLRGRGLLGGVGEKNQTDAALLAVVGLWLFQPALAVTDLWLQANLRARTSVLAQMIALSFGAAVRIALLEMRARFGPSAPSRRAKPGWRRWC